MAPTLTLVPPPAVDLTERRARQVRNVALSFLERGLTAGEWLRASPLDFAIAQEIGAAMKALASS